MVACARRRSSSSPQEVGYAGLPTEDAEACRAWFRQSADSGSLPLYLETFDHTLAVMQTAAGLRRVARECVEDLAADGVVYAESRFAPEQHLTQGLSLEEVVESVNTGFREGEALVAARGGQIRVTALLTAMRHAAKSTEIAELAVRYRDDGVSGFDIAGAEAGYPPTRHLDAFEYLRRENSHFTIHAGEAFGLPSIWEAIQWCGADRLGHGVRIVDDITIGGQPFAEWLGAPESMTRGPSSTSTWARSPWGASPPTSGTPVFRSRCARAATSRPLLPCRSRCTRSRCSSGCVSACTLNTDNRLMSDTSMSKEALLLAQQADWDLADLRWVTINAMKSAFIPFDQRLAIIEDVIKPGYRELGHPV